MLDDRARELEDIDKRIQALKDAAKQAELTTQKAIGPDGELQKHREAVQNLSSQALQTHATLDTLKKERAVLDELARPPARRRNRSQAGDSAQASTLKGELDQIRASASSLTQDYGKIRETSREAREDTTTAMATVKEVEKKLGPLAQIARAEPEHRRAPCRTERARRARVAQGEGAREPAAGGRARRRAGQSRQRDGLVDGRADHQAERRDEAGGESRRDHRPHRQARGRHGAAARGRREDAPGSPARDDQAAEGCDRSPRRFAGPKSTRWR